jgi:hypothetical protein
MVRISLRLDDDNFENLKNLKNSNGICRNFIINKILRENIAKEFKEKTPLLK